jgi:putative copper export protein
MGWTELALAGLRGMHIAASLVGFGLLIFWTVVAPPVLSSADTATRQLLEVRTRRLFRASIIVAAIAALVWLLAQAAYIADAGSILEAAAAVWPVMTATHFGRVLGIRLVLLALALLTLSLGTSRAQRTLAILSTGLALILQSWTAHAAAAEGPTRAILLSAETLHLLAAGTWIGSLVALFMLARALTPDQGARALLRFSPLGMLCVSILAATALVQGRLLIGTLPGLVGTDYGEVALLKLALFSTMLLLAATNRFHHARLLRGPQVGGRRRLQLSIGAEAVLGLAVIFAAAVLADLEPAVHQT